MQVDTILFYGFDQTCPKNSQVGIIFAISLEGSYERSVLFAYGQ